MRAEKISALCRDLGESLLFNLSLSSKELFHSNFIAWLCKSYPQEMGEILCTYIEKKEAHTRINTETVERERKNIDLSFKYNNGTKVVVELKVKSLPHEEQLGRYITDDCENYLLISMIRPHFFETTFEIQKKVWRFISYNEFVGKIRAQIIGKEQYKTCYHKDIILDYCIFSQNLCELVKLFSLGENDRFFIVDKEEIENLRIHDVIDKMRYSQLADYVYKTLRKNCENEIAVNRSNWWTHKMEGEICVWHGYSNMSGMMQAGILFQKHQKDTVELPFCTVGIQFQNKQFRLISEFHNPQYADDFAKELQEKNLWFDFSISSLTKQLPETSYKRKNSEFCKFNNFKYHYRTLDEETNTKEIIHGISDFMDELLRRKGNIAEIVSKYTTRITT